MLLPVLRRPFLSLPSQPLRSGSGAGGGGGGGGGSGAAATGTGAGGSTVGSALPPNQLEGEKTDLAAGAGASAGGAAGSGVGAGLSSAGFFLKKLNIGRFLQSEPFYETP